jgi:hypothetical protein
MYMADVHTILWWRLLGDEANNVLSLPFPSRSFKFFFLLTVPSPTRLMRVWRLNFFQRDPIQKSHAQTTDQTLSQGHTHAVKDRI